MTYKPNDSATLIAEYLAAHAACNSGLPAPNIRYGGGWYLFGSGGSRYRHRDLEAMVQRLKERAASNIAEPSGAA